MEIDTWFGNYVNVTNNKNDLEVAGMNYQKQIENLEDENTELKEILKESLEKQEALAIALDDIQHYLDIIRDVFHDLNKKDIYRNNF